MHSCIGASLSLSIMPEMRLLPPQSEIGEDGHSKGWTENAHGENQPQTENKISGWAAICALTR